VNKVRNLLIILGILLLSWCVWSIDELDTRTYSLRNCLNELGAKHGKLTMIVKSIHETVFRQPNKENPNVITES